MTAHFVCGADLYAWIQARQKQGRPEPEICQQLGALLSKQDIAKAPACDASIVLQLMRIMQGCHFFWNARVARIHACWLSAWLTLPGCDGYFDAQGGQRQHWLDAMVSHGHNVEEYGKVLEALEPGILLAHQGKLIEIMQTPDLGFAYFIEKYLHLKFEQSQNFDGIKDYLSLQCSRRSVFSAFKSMVSRFPGPAIGAYVAQGGDLMAFSDAMLSQSHHLRPGRVVASLGLYKGSSSDLVVATLPGLACLHGHYDMLLAMDATGGLDPDLVHIKSFHGTSTLRQLSEAFAANNVGLAAPLAFLQAKKNYLFARDMLREVRAF